MIIPQKQIYDNEINSDYKPPLMLSPPEAAERFKLPLHFVRTGEKQGLFVSIRVGRRILINADSVERYLNTGVPQGSKAPENEPEPVGRMAAICVK